MNFRTITFRQIFITLAILMFSNLCVNLFTASTTKATVPTTHVCSDSTHRTCDGNCECDGLGCNTSYDDEMLENMQEYQLQIENQGIIIWDGNRFVGFIEWNDPHCNLQKIILNDND